MVSLVSAAILNPVELATSISHDNYRLQEHATTPSEHFSYDHHKALVLNLWLKTQRWGHIADILTIRYLHSDS